MRFIGNKYNGTPEVGAWVSANLMTEIEYVYGKLPEQARLSDDKSSKIIPCVQVRGNILDASARFLLEFPHAEPDAVALDLLCEAKQISLRTFIERWKLDNTPLIVHNVKVINFDNISIRSLYEIASKFKMNPPQQPTTFEPSPTMGQFFGPASIARITSM